MKPILLFDVYVLLRHGELAGKQLGGLERVCLEELCGLISTERYEIVLCSSSGYERADYYDAFPALRKNVLEIAHCEILRSEKISFVQHLLYSPLLLLTKLAVKWITKQSLDNKKKLKNCVLWLMDCYTAATAPHFVFPSEWHARKIIYYSVYCQFPSGLPPQYRIFRIATVHDLVPLRFPDECSSYGRLTFLWMIRKMVQEADHLFMVSYFTRDDFFNYFSGISVSTSVNWNGISQNFLKPVEDFSQSVGLQYGIPRNARFFFTLAAAGKRKNLIFLCKCFLEFIQKAGISDLYLVIAGNIFKTSSELQALIRQSHGKLIAVGYINDADLPAIYHNAIGYLFVSKSEGFGLPLLEAMAARTPIIAACAGSLPEIAGNAALYINPCEQASIIQALEQLLAEPELRRKLIDNGSFLIHNFLWTDHIKRMTELFDSIGNSTNENRI